MNVGGIDQEVFRAGKLSLLDGKINVFLSLLEN